METTETGPHVVCDDSPVIHLDELGCLDLLHDFPRVISLLGQLAAGTASVGDESAYWRRVLHYCRQGNLQAVLDE